MLFESINKTYCWFFLILIFILELFIFLKSSQNLQTEIYLKKIDIINDKPGVVRLLPGVGEMKLAEILELRKTEKSASKIMEIIGLKSRYPENDSFLMED